MAVPAEIAAHQRKIEALEQSILDSCEPIECETYHYYAHGTYTRELHLPAGAVLTGKIHRHSCINILVKGKMAVATPEGQMVLEAPYTFVSSSGIAKAGYVLEDSIWINVHPWDGSPDLEAIEEEVIVPSYQALLEELE